MANIILAFLFETFTVIDARSYDTSIHHVTKALELANVSSIVEEGIVKATVI